METPHVDGEPVRAWASLDDAWREAFRQAWAAYRSGSIPVGACVSTADGEIIGASRNRVGDLDGPAGEVWGSSVAHAEMNVLARIPSRRDADDLVLTTTLEPCLQCAGAIRLARMGAVRFAGRDSYWEGCHEFGRLSAREAAPRQPARRGPLPGPLGRFAAVLSLMGPSPSPAYEVWLRSQGEGAGLDLARRHTAARTLAELDVADALGALWSELVELDR